MGGPTASRKHRVMTLFGQHPVRGCSGLSSQHPVLDDDPNGGWAIFWRGLMTFDGCGSQISIVAMASAETSIAMVVTTR